MNKRNKARLVLEDGSVYDGYYFGSKGTARGEVVFNTSMTGYQEIITDPSYRGQIVTMTYPLIGNTGVNPQDIESSRVQVSGFVIKELSAIPSSWRQTADLESYLVEHGVTGLVGIDTRALVRRLRNRGVMRGVISSDAKAPEELTHLARSIEAFDNLDLVADVTTDVPYFWNEPIRRVPGPGPQAKPIDKTVLVYDFGVKRNILRELVQRGCRVEVLPANISAQDALARKPDGIVLSNGPGDPQAVPYAIEIVKKLLGQAPLMGICLGHQLLALALGGNTYKMKFGHRGGNQPVLDLATNRVAITSQNHGYAVDMESLTGKPVTVSHINLNDRTVEGMWSEQLDFFSVQYHPEASPGPHDAGRLFDRFLDRIRPA
ncbi:MAG: glutamine-hydrolyzing carbamoyl-phosphate synthase small subunit [Deltaproteobacteria bacterium]|nr:glutamine-hydrolyzing carbamoyl-phosphate synthase small subunit [Deltaproteobacteria bacterium]